MKPHYIDRTFDGTDHWYWLNRYLFVDVLQLKSQILSSISDLGARWSQEESLAPWSSQLAAFAAVATTRGARGREEGVKRRRKNVKRGEVREVIQEEIMMKDEEPLLILHNVFISGSVQK